MKIGVAHRRFSSTGGSENYLKRFAGEALAQGHSCTLFTAEWPESEWPFGEVIRLKAGSQVEFADALLELNPHCYCDFLFGLDRIWSCDCYRAGGGVHQVWMQQRTAGEPFWKNWVRKFQKRHRDVLNLERRLFTPQSTPLLITNSKRVKQEIIDSHHYPAEQIKVVYNGIPEQQFDAGARARIREQLGLAPDTYTAIFVGNGWERKGLGPAIAAIERMKNIHLIVLGRGKQRKYPHSSRVHFAGAVRPVNDWLVAADVFVLPTLYDPFSNACLEAASAGLPVVTTVTNGFSEVIREGVTGSVVGNAEDVSQIAEKLEYWRPIEHRETAKPAAQKLAQELSIEKNVRETLSWFQQG